MSHENVEMVRRYYDAARRSFLAHWESPRSAAGAVDTDQLDPDAREMIGYMHPDVEWRNALGMVLRIDEHLDRAAALEAVGPAE